MSGRDPYQVLGVDRGADAETIRKAHRRAVKKTHPDMGGDRAKFEEAQRAWLILGDPERRRRYDETGDESDAGRAAAVPQAAVPQAVQVLAACWEEVLAMGEPCEDLLKLLKDALQVSWERCAKEIESAKAAREKWMRMSERLKVDAESPAAVLAHSIEDKARAAARKVEEFEGIAGAMKEAQELLAAATYEVPASERAAGEEAMKKRVMGMLEQMMGKSESGKRKPESGRGSGYPKGGYSKTGDAECLDCHDRYNFIRGSNKVRCPRCNSPFARDFNAMEDVDFRKVREERPRSNYNGYGSGFGNFPGGL